MCCQNFLLNLFSIINTGTGAMVTFVKIIDSSVKLKRREVLVFKVGVKVKAIAMICDLRFAKAVAKHLFNQILSLRKYR